MNDKTSEYEEFKGVTDTIRKTLLGLIGYAAFCIAILLQPDKQLFEKNSIKLPFANVDVELFPFLYLGGIFLIAITIYLYIFIHRWSILEKKQKWTTPVTIFNLPGLIPRLVSIALFFLLPISLLALFTWKVLPHAYGHWPVFLYYIVCSVLIYLWLKNNQCDKYLKTILYLCIIILLLLALDLLTVKNFQPYRSVDLRGANLSQRDLSGFNLSHALLEDANLNHSNLKGINLFRANMAQASIMNSDLENAILDNTNLVGTNFNFSFLGGSSMIDSWMINTKMIAVSLGNANLHNAYLNDVNLTGARLPGANLSGAQLNKVDLKGAYLAGVNFSNASLRKLDIRGAYSGRS